MGHEVVLQAWDFVSGSNFVSQMHSALASGARVVAVLSERYLNSAYAAAEWQTAWSADPDGSQRRLLVARIEDCSRPGLLRTVVSFDLFGLSADEAKSRLTASIAAAIGGRAKPSTPPQFPGQMAPAFPSAHHGPISNLPLRNAHFVGRSLELDALSNALDATASANAITIRGLGGTGKSALANEYAHQHLSEYRIVWWIDAGDAAQIRQSFRDLASAIEPGVEFHDAAELNARVGRTLTAAGSSLLIFDNAESVNAVREVLETISPSTDRRGIIVTTRRSGFSALARTIDLDVWSTADADTYLRNRIQASPEDARRLSATLGELPLALEQAASYIEITGISVSDYVDLFTQRTAEMLGLGNTEANTTVDAIWSISLERIAEADDAALQLLDLCAYMDNLPIPLSLFREHSDYLDDPLATAARDDLRLNAAISVLLDYSIVKRRDDAIRLHHLTQAAIRAKHDAGRGPDDISQYLTPVIALLRGALPENVLGQTDDWETWSALLPHVLAATSLFSQERTFDDGLRPTYSDLLSDAAAYLQVLGDPESAAAIYAVALATDQDVRGDADATVARRLNDRALALKASGRPDEALPLAERAVEIMLSLYGEDHPNVAIDIATLSLILDDLGRYPEALAQAERALRITRDTVGDSSRAMVRRLGNLGYVHLHMKASDRARECIDHAIVLAEDLVGADHELYAAMRVALAEVDIFEGDLLAARDNLLQAESVLTEKLGKTHPDTLQVVAKLVAILHALGDHDWESRYLDRLQP